MNSLHRAFNILIAATVGLYIALGVVVVVGWIFLSNVNGTFCNFRENLQSQVDAQRQYLIDVDTGVRKLPPGISKNDILAAVRRQQKTLDSTSGLRCE